MKTLILEITNDSDLKLLLDIAQRLKMKSTVTEAPANLEKAKRLKEAMTEIQNEPGGQYLTVKQFKKSINKAESEPPIAHYEGQNIINGWIQELDK